MSAKRRRESAEYKVLREAFLGLRRLCEAQLSGCNFHSQDIHHKAGRGKNYLEVSTWMPVCRICHRWITDHKEQAIQKGWSYAGNRAPSDTPAGLQ